MFLGIDLSLRSTGLVFLSDTDIQYQLVNNKKLDDESLILSNFSEITSFIEKTKPTNIGIEGLSFGSISSSKDIIAGNFWYLRTQLYHMFPNIKVDIIPVLTWRSKLFNKEERQELKKNETALKTFKRQLMHIPQNEKKQYLLDNQDLVLKANIKYLTYCKLPSTIQDMFHVYGFTKGTFDLSDAYFIADYLKNNVPTSTPIITTSQPLHLL